MSALPDWLPGTVSRVETFFDHLKLGYKWRFGRWDELKILTYRGYGTPSCIRVKGRVLDDKGASIDREGAPPSVWKGISNTIRRFETDEIPSARVRVCFQDRTLELETDEDGFFDAAFAPTAPLDEGRLWHDVDVALLRPEDPDGADVRATAPVIVPPPEAAFGVISDLDDTVIRTGATDALRMARTVLLNSARTRTPFAGVAPFYRALQQGTDGHGGNPIFYVSSSPWNLYGLFEGFMEAQDVPPGPIFLKDFGFSDTKFIKSGHQSHKLDHIRMLLDAFPDLPFVLIGDSGQEDPEIYHTVVREQPERFRAVYIRDVTPDRRDRQVRALAEEVEALGVPMLLAEVTEQAARHAADHGLIAPDALEAVQHARRTEQDRTSPGVVDRLLG